eukprot:1736211-Rhodomonas_salina.2
MGQASLQWDTDKKEGAYAGQKVGVDLCTCFWRMLPFEWTGIWTLTERVFGSESQVYDHVTADHSHLLNTSAENPSLQIANTSQFGEVSALIFPVTVAPEPVEQPPQPSSWIGAGGGGTREANKEEEDDICRSYLSTDNVATERGRGTADKTPERKAAADSISLTSSVFIPSRYSRRSGAPASLNKELGEDFFWR